MITIGIDPHKASHTAVALDAGGRVQGELRCLANQATLERLLRWAERWPERIWAVEGAAGLGHLLAQQLVAREETVLDVPATLAARARLLAPGHGRKTDGIDAASVATVAQNQPDLRRVGPEDHSACCGSSRIAVRSSAGSAAGQSTGSTACFVICVLAVPPPSCRRRGPRNSSATFAQERSLTSSAR